MKKIIGLVFLTAALLSSEPDVNLISLRRLMNRQNQQTVIMMCGMGVVGLAKLADNWSSVCPDTGCWKIVFPVVTATATLGWATYKYMSDKPE